MTPLEIDNDVKRLLDLIGIDEQPIFLRVTPEPYSGVCECFPAVAEKIARDGGSDQLGWQIWRTEILAEAEFHAVWKSADGSLKDITPKQVPTDRVLFLPDPKAQYEGRQVDNIRLNITNNRLVDEFIEVSKAIFRFQNEGVRALQHEIQLSPREAELFESLQSYKEGICLMATNGMTRNWSCFCGSGKKYKHCHGYKILDALKKIE